MHNNIEYKFCLKVPLTLLFPYSQDSDDCLEGSNCKLKGVLSRMIVRNQHAVNDDC